MSTYRTDSELSRINAADAGSATAVSDQTAEVVRTALDVSAVTDGAFDPTIGALVDLWGFGPADRAGGTPATDDVAAARTAVNYRAISIDGDRVTKGSADVRLDFSGVAKGYGVDLVAQLLDAKGVTDYLVEVGGELRAKGRPAPDRAWRVGIEKPNPGPGEMQRVVDLDGDALATSGNYRIFFEADGRRYPHIIDPRSGWPVDHELASATVVGTSTMEADALSTSMMVLGPEAAMELAAAQGIAAYLIVGRDGAFSGLASPEFTRRFGA